MQNIYTFFIFLLANVNGKMNQTSEQFDKVIGLCKDIFFKKLEDYGTAWRIMRPESVTDQIFIKAQRIRSIEEKGESKVDEGMTDFNVLPATTYYQSCLVVLYKLLATGNFWNPYDVK